MVSWIGLVDDRVRTAVMAALGDVGEHEIPESSNSGAWVDETNAMFDSPKGSYWCANAASRWWKTAALSLPPEPGSCESWHQWAKTTKRWALMPKIGSQAVYGDASGHAHHIGLVVCEEPMLTIEGNTTLEGYSRNGELVTLKMPDTKHILGYVRPDPMET